MHVARFFEFPTPNHFLNGNFAQPVQLMARSLRRELWRCRNHGNRSARRTVWPTAGSRLERAILVAALPLRAGYALRSMIQVIAAGSQPSARHREQRQEQQSAERPSELGAYEVHATFRN